MPGIDTLRLGKRKPMTDCACAEIRRQGRKTRRLLAALFAALSTKLDQVVAGNEAIFTQQEKLMSAQDDLVAADNALKTEMGAFLAALPGLISAAVTAAKAGDDAQTESVVADINTAVASLAALHAAAPPVTTPPASAP